MAAYLRSSPGPQLLYCFLFSRRSVLLVFLASFSPVHEGAVDLHGGLASIKLWTPIASLVFLSYSNSDVLLNHSLCPSVPCSASLRVNRFITASPERHLHLSLQCFGCLCVERIGFFFALPLSVHLTVPCSACAVNTVMLALKIISVPHCPCFA